MKRDTALLLASVASTAVAIDNGFGRTPLMGFNTYNAAACTVNQTYVRDSITALSQQGFVDLGYKIFQIDCGWYANKRAANGSITYRTSNFPDGIAPLSKYAISKGMQWSMYTGATPYQCDIPYNEDWPASQYSEEADAKQFAGWNAVYVKADNCFGPDDTLVQRFTNMSNALNKYGIPGLLVCEWGLPATINGGPVGPEGWAPSIATSFRVSADIAQGWSSVYRITNEAIHINLKGISKPGQFGDMDLLEVGQPGMTVAEQATHFATWAMFKSALFMSTSLSMSSDTRTILTNKGLIAINQDSLGAPVTLVQRYPTYDIYSGPLANGDVAVLMIDQSGNGGTMYVDFNQFGVGRATVTDLWSGSSMNGYSNWYAKVDGHGHAALRLSNVQKSTQSAPTYTRIAGSSGSVSNGASMQTCTNSACTNNQAVGYLGNGNQDGGGKVTFSNIYTSQGTQNVKFDYLQCEVIYPNQSGPNARGARITVNGGSPVDIIFPMSGYNWQQDVLTNFLVQLTGFSTTGPNTVTISGIPGGVSGTSGYAPNIAGFSVVK